MITVEQNQLVRTLATAAAPIGGKSPMAILNGIRIEATGGKLSAVGSDLVTTVRAECECAGNMAAVVVPAAVVERAKLMPVGKVTIEVDAKGAITIASGKRKFKLDTQNAADFPDVTVMEPNGAPVNAKDLASAIERGSRSMPDDSTRPNLYGARFVGGEVRSANNYGLAISSSPIDTDVMLPPPAVSHIVKFADGSDEVRVGMNGTRFVLARPGAAISVQTVDGSDFPNFDALIFDHVKKDTPSLKIDRAALINALRAVSTSTGDESRRVTVDVSKGEMRLQALGGTKGEAEDSVPCEAARPIKFGVNASMLASAVTASDGAEVVIQNGGEMDPIIIRGQTTTHVVMPLRA